MKQVSIQQLLTGLFFSILWASASAAGKFGLYSVEPLLFFNMRFILAGLALLSYAYVLQSNRLPMKNEWKHLTIFGALNTTLYLGLFIIALQTVTPGITTLAIVLNPLFISIMSAVWLKRKVLLKEWLSIFLGIIGVAVAAYPLLQNSYATLGGLLLLALSMIVYSIGSVYYSAVSWQLPRITINGWQVFIGGILLIPFTLLEHKENNQFNLSFWLSLLWLIFPVSILGVQLWLRLLKSDAVRASQWLYLCPIFGFLYAKVLFNEPLTIYTLLGTVVVMLALYLGQRTSNG